MWFVVRNIILSSPEATPSRALRKPENVTEDWYLAQKKHYESRLSDHSFFAHGILAIPVFACLNPFVERRVNVFHEDYAPFGSVREEVEELVVC
jgi:hypothetical protein